MDKLKPCPFCGDPNPEVESVKHGLVVQCINGCGEGPFDLRQSGAIAAWNTRPIEDDLLATLQPLADYCAEVKAVGDKPVRLLVPFEWLEQAATTIAKATGGNE